VQALPQVVTEAPEARSIETWVPEAAEVGSTQPSERLASLTDEQRETLAALAEGAMSEGPPQARIAANRQATIVRAGGEADYSTDGKQQLIPRSFPVQPHWNELRGETTGRPIEQRPNTLTLQPLRGDAPLQPLVRFSPGADLPLPKSAIATTATPIAPPAAPLVAEQPAEAKPVAEELTAEQPSAEPQPIGNPLRDATQPTGGNPLR
jgi:hypothetical protein